MNLNELLNSINKPCASKHEQDHRELLCELYRSLVSYENLGKHEGRKQVRYVTIDDLDEQLLAWMEREFSKAILGDEAMNEHSHEDHSRNWPPPKHELDKFRCVIGNYVFVLESLLKGTVTLTLQYTFGVRSERHPVASTEQDYDWGVSCRFKYAKAVSDAIPRAEAFLRNLTARVKLPEDCEWIYLDGLCVRDNRSGTVYPIPTDARRADILDAVVKESRRTHPSK